MGQPTPSPDRSINNSRYVHPGPTTKPQGKCNAEAQVSTHGEARRFILTNSKYFHHLELIHRLAKFGKGEKMAAAQTTWEVWCGLVVGQGKTREPK